MQQLRRSITFLLSLFAVVAVCGCSRTTRFSPVMNGAYEPPEIFRLEGYVVQAEVMGEVITNAQYGYAWRSWCGVLTRPANHIDAKQVAVTLRDSLNRILSNDALDELTNKVGDVGQPLTGMLRYNKDEVHGDLYVWLLPNTVGDTISYVIFVREERLR